MWFYCQSKNTFQASPEKILTYSEVYGVLPDTGVQSPAANFPFTETQTKLAK